MTTTPLAMTELLSNRFPVFAACIAFVNDDDELLTIERGDGTGIALIAGKREPSETPAQAAAREAFEEAGIIVDPRHLVLVFERVTENDHLVQTFIPRRWQGTPRSSHEGVVRWRKPAALIEEGSAFPLYNRELLRRLFPTASF